MCVRWYGTGPVHGSIAAAARVRASDTLIHYAYWIGALTPVNVENSYINRLARCERRCVPDRNIAGNQPVAMSARERERILLGHAVGICRRKDWGMPCQSDY